MQGRSLWSSLLFSLQSIGLREYFPEDGVRVFALRINYGVFEGGEIKIQYLVVRVFTSPNVDYINVWVDKQYVPQSWVNSDDVPFPDMGNGFIHKSLRTQEDVFAFMQAVSMAL